jgi:hypothetical protein
MASGFVLVCSVEPVNGACPAGSESWVSSSALDPFAMPSQVELAAAFNAAIEVFFIPTMIAMICALGVRWVLEQIS